MSDSEQGGPDYSGSGPVEYRGEESSSLPASGRLSADAEARLLAVPGVTSVGLGAGAPGAETIVIGVVDAGVAAVLPSDVEGLPVTVQITGEVDALDVP